MSLSPFRWLKSCTASFANASLYVKLVLNKEINAVFCKGSIGKKIRRKKMEHKKSAENEK